MLRNESNSNRLIERRPRCRFRLLASRKRSSANSILHFKLRVGFERRTELHRAFLAAHADAQAVVTPFPIHGAESCRKPFHTHRHVEPFLWDAGADDERWFTAGFVDVG